MPSINYYSLLQWLVIIYMTYHRLPCVSISTCCVIIFSCKGEFVNVRQIFVMDGTPVWLTSPIKLRRRERERERGLVAWWMWSVTFLIAVVNFLLQKTYQYVICCFPDSLGMQKLAGKDYYVCLLIVYIYYYTISYNEFDLFFPAHLPIVIFCNNNPSLESITGF